MIERRAMERYAVNLPVRIQTRDDKDDISPKSLTTVNICSGGAYLRMENPLPARTRVVASVILPFPSDQDGHRNTVEVTGTVMRTEGNGVAIAFDRKYRFAPVPEDRLETI